MLSVERPLSVDAVLFDRDGTLIVDVPYNGDPDQVVPMPNSKAALDLVRQSGLKVGLVSNQSGVARGLITPEQVESVNRRVAQLLGPFDSVHVCLHAPEDGCRCRKPSPQMILDAAKQLGLAPERTALVGDIGTDMEAATRAGAQAVMVPTSATLSEEVQAAPNVADNIYEAVELLLSRS